MTANPLSRRGTFILFEGCDRCGKTTQSTKLVEALKARGIKAELVKFPDRTTAIGRMINSYLAEGQNVDLRAIHLLFSANRWEAMESMKSRLQSGITLVVDRYAYSGVAYTAAKGLDMDWCKSSDVGLLRPDMVFYLDMPPVQATKRGDYGAERYERLELQTRVYENFAKLRESDWNVINAALPIETIHNEIVSLSLDKIEKISSRKEPLLENQAGAKGLWQ